MSLRHRIGYWLLRWPEVPKETRYRVYDAVQSAHCACGDPKMPGQPFCPECYRMMPLTTKRRLHLMLRRGFILEYERVKGRAALRKVERAA